MSALPVQDIFDALHDAGLSVSLAPSGGLVVSPGSRLTPDLRELVKGNKAALVDWLHAANDPDANSRLVGLSRLVWPVAEKLAEESLEPPTNPNAWRELATAYHHHHFACPVCIAAGRGAGYGLRCGTGAALWTSYSDATERPDKKGRP